MPSVTLSRGNRPLAVGLSHGFAVPHRRLKSRHIQGLVLLLTSVVGFYVSPTFGQISVLTQHYDNSRTGQNTDETILTHANVNSIQFGKLFTQSLDGMEAAQPLYIPNVFIPTTNSSHNVVYAVTQHDSVYAFDADNNQLNNASPLWYVNLLDPAHGITTVPLADEKCQVSGYTKFGIQGTPVIDIGRNAIYVLAMTKENGNYVNFADGGAGGNLSPSSANTNTKGIAGTRYTTPSHVGPVTVTASAAGLASATFTINVD
jgi:hypothetical protein